VLSAGINFGVDPRDRRPSNGTLTRGGGVTCTTLARRFARKQQLLERLQEDPGPQERDEIGRLFVQIDAALDLVDEAGPDTTAREAIRNADQ
jgi:hypothetical protein